MPKRKTVTPEEVAKRESIALEFSTFRENYKFTQKMLAETLKSIDTDKSRKCPGISRRTIQMIEGGVVTPHDHTLKLFSELKARHEKNKGR
jgi:hypothetical protein